MKGMRKAYMEKGEVFTESQLVSQEPFEQFRDWFEIASKTPGIEEPNAMCLATATKDGRPSARMVLLKGYGPNGFKFFTNYKSRKASELDANPYASLNFYWEPLKRCVRIEGKVEKLSTEESTEYFMSRPESSRIGAIVSPQSQPIPSRDYLSEKQTELTQLAQEKPEQICKPENWFVTLNLSILFIIFKRVSLVSFASQRFYFRGGYIVVPDMIEFWQGQTNRLHDRIRFRKLKPDDKPDNAVVHQGKNGWVYERLAP
ncbi:unnamed protein product [Orchesella dallaii]|uniref:pyridoxal 5'-phosphate synthase n=1 Tax=Orchesella dallaii TaxID=48710 RepID=A0ABP1S251_9HEXA